MDALLTKFLAREHFPLFLLFLSYDYNTTYNDLISILPVLPVSTIVKTPRVAFLYSQVPAPLQMQMSRKLSWETLFELVT